MLARVSVSDVSQSGSGVWSVRGGLSRKSRASRSAVSVSPPPGYLPFPLSGVPDLT